MKTRLTAQSLMSFAEKWKMTEEQAHIILEVLADRDCGLCVSDSGLAVIHNDGTIQDLPHSGMDGVLNAVWSLNIEELLGAYSVSRHEEVTLRMRKIMPLMEKRCFVERYCMGHPTVGELIDVLSVFPKDALVSCCGTDLSLYINADGICLDCKSNPEI